MAGDESGCYFWFGFKLCKLFYRVESRTFVKLFDCASFLDLRTDSI